MNDRTAPGGQSPTRGDRQRGRATVVCTDGGAPVNLFEVTVDPVIRYECPEQTPVVATVNDAYRRTFAPEVESGPLSARLSEDVGSEPNEAELDSGPLREVVEAARAGNTVRTAVRAGAADRVRDFLLQVAPADGGGHGYVVLTDITAQRDRARELQAQRDRLDEFASIVSHDLRNPLDVAKVRLEAARDTGEDVHFRKVEGAHDRIEAIIADVLKLARHGQVIDEVDVVSLEAVVRDAWGSVSAPQASLTVDTQATLEADAERLQELLENLFRNAVEHGDDDVTLTVGELDTGRGFYVADDGPGIPDDEQSRVFDAGFTTGKDGTGLGLVIVDRIAEAHGWNASVTDAENGGARFEFTGVNIHS